MSENRTEELYEESTEPRSSRRGFLKAAVAGVAGAALATAGCKGPGYIWVPRGDYPTGRDVTKTHDVEINSVPAGADVWIDGVRRGKTPVISEVEYKSQIRNRVWEGRLPYESRGHRYYYANTGWGWYVPLRQELFEKPVSHTYRVQVSLPGYGRQEAWLRVPDQDGHVFHLQKQR